MSAPSLSTPTVVIPANGELPFDATGSFVMNMTSSGNLFVRIGDGRELRFNAGDKHRLDANEEKYRQVTLINKTGSAVSATLATGDGDVKTATVVSGTIKTAGGGNGSYGAVSVLNTATQIVAADADVTGMLISNNASETVYIGSDNAVTTANGLPLLAGASMGWDGQHALYGIAVTGPADVRYLKQGV